MIFYFLRGSLPWSGLEAKSQEPPFPGAFVEGFWRFGFPGAFVAFGGFEGSAWQFGVLCSAPLSMV